MARRVTLLNEKLRSCVICPHHCRVNRLEGELGFAGVAPGRLSAAMGRTLAKKRPWWVGAVPGPSFAYCTLQCVFCQNCEISHYGMGDEVSPSELALIMLSLQEKGCHNINLVSPTHYIPQIVHALSLAVKKA